MHAVARPHPRYSRAEVLADAAIHVAAMLGAITASLVLVVTALRVADAPAVAAVAVYGTALVAMPFASATYHFTPDAAYRPLFRRIDQAVIFVLIAASYTPFAVIALEGWWTVGLLALVWLVAAAGVALKLLRPAGLQTRVSVALYLALGWCGLLALPALIAALTPTTLALLATGGILYTVGVIFHLWERLRFHNAIWHGFVVSAAAFHVAAVGRLLA